MQHQMMHRAWHSGSSTPVSDEDASSGEAVAPGPWPAPYGMEALIRRTLEEDDVEGGVVERLAERIARGRRPTGLPRPLKRHETT